MPSAPTKSFAEFPCRRASLRTRSRPARPAPPASRRAANRKMPEAAKKPGMRPGRHASTDAKHRRLPRNGHAKLPSSARQLAERRPKSGAANAGRQTTVQTRRTVRRAIDPRWHAVLAVVLLVFLAPVIARAAHSPAALQQFEIGKQAFAAQDYASALVAFEAAAAAGMSGPAVQFNIGVCAYRTGRWSRAESA